MWVVVLILLFFSGCSSDSSEPGFFSQLYTRARLRFSSGHGELQKAFDAKKQARSWRMVTVLKAHPGRALETAIEISCPDHERIVTTLGDTRYESVRIGKESWSKGTGMPNWTKQPVNPEAYPCGSNAGAPAPWAMMNEGGDMTTVVATMAKTANAEVTRGELTKVRDMPCQEWVVNFQHPGSSGSGGRGMTYSVCISPEDNLPRQIAMGSGGLVTIYSDWNMPMNIQPPATSAATK